VIFRSYGVKEVRTIDSDLLVKQAELESRFGLSYFDSMITASTLSLDKAIISDDKAFDKIPGLRRLPLSE